MYRKILSLAGGLLLCLAPAAFAQEEAGAAPAASRSEMDCSGFISGMPISKDAYVFDGADNDNREPLHQFGLTGSYVYLTSRTGQGFAVGGEYAVVRPATELMRIKKYAGQGASVRSLGRLYEDIAKVKVFTVTPVGAVAEVVFACGPVRSEDLVIPFQARAIPAYTPTPRIERFAPANGKLVGAITAAGDNATFVGQGRIAYINLGQEDGVRAGQRFRVFRIFREGVSRGFMAPPETPRETIGELVILSTQERSSVTMVVNSLREISLGDGIELLD